MDNEREKVARAYDVLMECQRIDLLRMIALKQVQEAHDLWCEVCEETLMFAFGDGKGPRDRDVWRGHTLPLKTIKATPRWHSEAEGAETKATSEIERIRGLALDLGCRLRRWRRDYEDKTVRLSSDMQDTSGSKNSNDWETAIVTAHRLYDACSEVGDPELVLARNACYRIWDSLGHRHYPLG